MTLLLAGIAIAGTERRSHDRPEHVDRQERAMEAGIDRGGLPPFNSGGARVAEVERRIADKTTSAFHRVPSTQLPRGDARSATVTPITMNFAQHGWRSRSHPPTSLTSALSPRVADAVSSRQALDPPKDPSVVRLPNGRLAVRLPRSPQPPPVLPPDVSVEAVAKKVDDARKFGDIFAYVYTATWFFDGGWLDVKSRGYSDKAGNYLFGVVTRRLGLSLDDTVSIGGVYEATRQVTAMAPWLLQQCYPVLAQAYDAKPFVRPNVQSFLIRLFVSPMSEFSRIETLGLASLDDPEDVLAIQYGYSVHDMRFESRRVAQVAPAQPRAEQNGVLDPLNSRGPALGGRDPNHPANQTTGVGTNSAVTTAAGPGVRESEPAVRAPVREPAPTEPRSPGAAIAPASEPGGRSSLTQSSAAVPSTGPVMKEGDVGWEPEAGLGGLRAGAGAAGAVAGAAEVAVSPAPEPGGQVLFTPSTAVPSIGPVMKEGDVSLELEVGLGGVQAGAAAAGAVAGAVGGTEEATAATHGGERATTEGLGVGEVFMWSTLGGPGMVIRVLAAGAAWISVAMMSLVTAAIAYAVARVIRVPQ